MLGARGKAPCLRPDFFGALAGTVQGLDMTMTYATPLLTFGVIGLAATCFVANGIGAPPVAPAAPAPIETPAAPPSAPAKAAPVAVAPPEAAPAPAAVNPADNAARVEACQGEVNRIVSANPIDFLRDRIELTAKGKATLGELAMVVRACPAMNIEIQGHTDKTGKRQNNIRLSRKRAEAVKQYLVELGLSPGTLTAVGFGPDHPVASNRTQAGRAQNRRIDFRVSRGE
jgi:outer membrane protein OmpA-like peptidoglycan-associated protein